MRTKPAVVPAPVYTARKTCRGCLSKSLTSVLNLGIQYLPRFVKHPDPALPKAPLHLVRCSACGLLQLNETVNPDLLYREFWYRSGVNDTMKAALEDVAALGVSYHDKGQWLDIGANDGFLLSKLPASFHKWACEPALNFKSELEELADVVVSDYFSAKKCVGPFDVITSVAMFYDLDEPGLFLNDIVKVLAPDGVWINQLNDSPTMMKANAFDAICHEHLCYYDLPTLSHLYERHGLRIVSVSHNDVNGGSVRVVAKHARETNVGPDPTGWRHVSSQEAEEFGLRTVRWRRVFGDWLAGLRTRPWCYGASTKGGTLLQYLDADQRLFAGVADRNPRKHDLLMVGSWLPIRSESEFRKARPDFAVVLPWAFKAEFDAREAVTRAEGTTFVYPLPEITFVV